ncbi:MAG: hypothetical protein MK086_07840 [Flavobacteriales bacterium]|nr:hypothetical protein [Flavobacteriales bacterium]
MRRILFIFLLLGLALSGSAQDLIITDTDSIECKVTKQDDQFVYFTYLNENGIQSVLIANEEAKQIIIGFHDDKQSILTTTPRSTRSSLPGLYINRVHLSLSYVWSRRVAPIDDELPQDLQNYLDELRGGRGLQMRGHYFINDKLGLGFNYNKYNATHQIQGSIEDLETGDVFFGTISDDVEITFFGPSVMGRHFFDPSWHINFSGSIGYMGFRNRSKVVLFDIEQEANTLGIVGDFGLEHMFARNLGIGIGVNFVLGGFTSFEETVDGVTTTIELEGGGESLTRVGFFAGMRFYFGE